MKKDMRFTVTERMLREGMLRCLEAKTLSRITVSDVCRESGINRATFYNHYNIPASILREIAREYASRLSSIYSSNHSASDKDDSAAVEACISYVSEKKSELKVLFSENAENYLAGAAMEIINEKTAEKASAAGTDNRSDEYLLMAATSASAAFGFIQIWLTTDISMTPKELVGILKSVIRGNVFM
ncbi:MAG: TetR/AcrR family transcriptional regulator [Oscillospiraceae bacterium]|nr:TetR/AcrR family transcriptional regulator [Oscillospiraceae bacterium]